LLISVVDQPDVLYDLSSGTTNPVPAPMLDPLAQRMLQEGFMLSGGGSKILFSPDGSSVAVAHGSIQIWNVQTRQLIQAFSMEKPLSITGMAFSSDGKRLAVITYEGNVISWNTRTGGQELFLSAEALATVQVFAAYGGAEPGPGIGADAISEQGIAFSPDGRHLALGNGTVVEVWDVTTGNKVRTLEQNLPAAFPTSVSYSSDGKKIYAILNRNRDAAVWDAFTGKLIRQYELPRVDPNAFTAIALNNSLFARNNYDESDQWIEIWDLEKEQIIRLPTHIREVEPLRFSENGEFLIALVDHRQLYIWRTDTGQLVFVSDKVFDIGDMAISPDGRSLATATYGKVSLWDISPYSQAAYSSDFVPPPYPPTETPWFSSRNDYPTSTPQPTQIVAILTQPSLPNDAITTENASQVRQETQFGNGNTSQISWIGDKVFISSSQGVYEYDTRLLKETRRFEFEDLWVTNSQVLSDGRILVAGSTFKGKIQVWDVTNNKKLVDLPGIGEPAINPDGKWLVFVNESQGLETINLETGQMGNLLNSKWHSLKWPVFSPDGKLVAAIQSDWSVRVWDLATGVIVDGVGGLEADITDMSFSPDGKYIVGASGGSAWVWSLIPSFMPQEFNFFEGTINGNLTLFEKTVTAVAMNSDSSLIAIGTSEHDVWIYDRKTARTVTKLTSDNSVPVKLTFSPDGSQLVSIDRDGKMILWDLPTQRPLVVSQSHIGPIRGIVMRQDGAISAWARNSVWVLEAKDATITRSTFVPIGEILSVSPAGDLAASYSPLRVSLFDAKTGEFKQTLPEEAEDVFVDYQFEGQILRQFYGAMFSLDGKKLATFGAGGVWMYDLPEGKLVSHLEGIYTRKSAFSPDGAWLVASLFEQGGNLFLVNFMDGEQIFSFSFPDFNYPINEQYVFSPNNKWIGIVANHWSEPAVLLLIDTSNGMVAKSLPFENKKLASLAFSSDSKLVAVGQDDGQIVLVDIAGMKIIATLDGHKGAVTSLAFSHDGRFLVSIGVDGIMKVWGIP
jgi:WD40 repeat protein